MDAHMRKGCTMACNSVRVRGALVGQVCHHLAFEVYLVADFWSFFAIFTLFGAFLLCTVGGVFAHFSDIFRICWDFLGDPRQLFRRLWCNFGHF